MPPTLPDPFDLPQPALILIGAGTHSLPERLPARQAFCSPLTIFRRRLAEQRALLFGVPIFFVSAGRGLVGLDEMVVGGEPLLINPDLIKQTQELLKIQLDSMPKSIVELHSSQQVASIVEAALGADELVKITTPRIHKCSLSIIFREYKEALCRSST